MIVLDESIKLILLSFIYPLNIYFHYNMEIERTFGQKGCLLMHLFLLGTIMVVVNQFYGGFFITLMRLLYIQANSVLTWMGEKIVAAMLVSAYIATVVSVTINYIYSRNRTWKMDECLQGLEEYQIFNLNSPVTVCSFALVMIAELLMNVWICYVFYHQDKQVRHLLLPQRYKRRNVKNAIDFFCHMLHFVLEILLTLFVILGSRISGPKTVEKEKLSEWIGIIFQLTSGVIPLTVICLSETLKQELRSTLTGISFTFSTVTNCGKNDSSFVNTGRIKYLPFTEWSKDRNIFHMEMKTGALDEVKNFKEEQTNPEQSEDSVPKNKAIASSKAYGNSDRQLYLPGVPDIDAPQNCAPEIDVQVNVHCDQRE